MNTIALTSKAIVFWSDFSFVQLYPKWKVSQCNARHFAEALLTRSGETNMQKALLGFLFISYLHTCPSRNNIWSIPHGQSICSCSFLLSILQNNFNHGLTSTPILCTYLSIANNLMYLFWYTKICIINGIIRHSNNVRRGPNVIGLSSHGFSAKYWLLP
jgi:hypothetical protein